MANYSYTKNNVSSASWIAHLQVVDSGISAHHTEIHFTCPKKTHIISGNTPLAQMPHVTFVHSDSQKTHWYIDNPGAKGKWTPKRNPNEITSANVNEVGIAQKVMDDAVELNWINAAASITDSDGFTAQVSSKKKKAMAKGF